jgi:hypothetical protein
MRNWFQNLLSNSTLCRYTAAVNSFAPDGADLSAKVTREEMEAAAVGRCTLESR